MDENLISDIIKIVYIKLLSGKWGVEVELE